MGNRYLIGVGLGLVAAIAFASGTTGSLAARFLLFFITPLPIALAGLGWGLTTAAIAGVTGTVLVAAGTSSLLVALAFALSQVVPMVALCHLALLNRAGAAGGETIEWYPIGRLVVWAAVMSGLLAMAAFLVTGDLDALRTTLGEFIAKTVKDSLAELPEATPLSDIEIKALSDAVLWLLPAALAISWMASLLFNLWLAGHVTIASGQLVRPWPDLAAMEYPRGTGLAFAVSLLGALTLGGHAALAASGFAGAFFLAFLLLGLAIVHYTTRSSSWRSLVLWTLYAGLIFLNVWVAVPAAILGLSESIFGFRRRYAQAGPSS